jgi:Flp pilus assembly protein TadD
MGKYEASIDRLTAAIEFANNKPSLYNNMGLSYIENGEFGLAVASFDKACSLEKENPVYFNNQGLSYV